MGGTRAPSVSGASRCLSGNVRPGTSTRRSRTIAPTGPGVRIAPDTRPGPEKATWRPPAQNWPGRSWSVIRPPFRLAAVSASAGSALWATDGSSAWPSAPVAMAVHTVRVSGSGQGSTILPPRIRALPMRPMGGIRRGCRGVPTSTSCGAARKDTTTSRRPQPDLGARVPLLLRQPRAGRLQ